jgi:hypothetical protein
MTFGGIHPYPNVWKIKYTNLIITIVNGNNIYLTDIMKLFLMQERWQESYEFWVTT